MLIIKIYALTCKPPGNFCKVTKHTSQMLYRDRFISYPIAMQMPQGDRGTCQAADMSKFFFVSCLSALTTCAYNHSPKCHPPPPFWSWSSWHTTAVCEPSPLWSLVSLFAVYREIKRSLLSPFGNQRLNVLSWIWFPCDCRRGGNRVFVFHMLLCSFLLCEHMPFMLAWWLPVTHNSRWVHSNI